MLNPTTTYCTFKNFPLLYAVNQSEASRNYFFLKSAFFGVKCILLPLSRVVRVSKISLHLIDSCDLSMNQYRLSIIYAHFGLGFYGLLSKFQEYFETISNLDLNT